MTCLIWHICMAHLGIAHWQMRLCVPLLLVGAEQDLEWTAAMSNAVYFHQASFLVRHMHV